MTHFALFFFNAHSLDHHGLENETLENTYNADIKQIYVPEYPTYPGKGPPFSRLKT